MCDIVQAGNEARTLLLERESQRMRSELAALREGRNIVVPLRLSPLERCSTHPSLPSECMTEEGVALAYVFCMQTWQEEVTR